MNNVIGNGAAVETGQLFCNQLSDETETEDADCFPGDLVEVQVDPLSFFGHVVHLGQITNAGQHQSHNVLCHGVGVHAGAVGHDDPMAFGCFGIHRVHTGSVTGKDLHLRRGAHGLLAPGLAVGDAAVDIPDHGQQFFKKIIAVQVRTHDIIALVQQHLVAGGAELLVIGFGDQNLFHFLTPFINHILMFLTGNYGERCFACSVTDKAG